MIVKRKKTKNDFTNEIIKLQMKQMDQNEYVFQNFT